MTATATTLQRQPLKDGRSGSGPRRQAPGDCDQSRGWEAGHHPQYPHLVTTLPTWAVYAVSFGTPLSAFVGVIIGHLLLRRGATELDVWRRREETMRLLRWASEQAASSHPAKARMGVAALDALSNSELLQTPDQELVDAVIDSLIEKPVEEIEQARGAHVIEVDDDRDHDRVED